MIQQNIPLKPKSYSEIKDMFIRLSCNQLNINHAQYIKKIVTESDKDLAIKSLYEQMDSLDKLELTMHIESALNITFPNSDELLNINIADDVLQYICKVKNIPMTQKTVEQKIDDKKISFMEKLKNKFAREK